MTEERIGYLTGKLEALESDVKDLAVTVREHVEWEQGYHDRHMVSIERIPVIEQRLEQIVTQISFARMTIQILKALGLTVIFLISFNWQPIRDVWHHVFEVTK